MRQEVAIRSAFKIAERLAACDGVVDTPDCAWSQFRFNVVWLFGSTAQGKKEPGDIDIMYDAASGGVWQPDNLFTGKSHKGHADYVALVWLRRGLKLVRYHDYYCDNFALDHGAIQLWPVNELVVAADALVTKRYRPVKREDFE